MFTVRSKKHEHKAGVLAAVVIALFSWPTSKVLAEPYAEVLGTPAHKTTLRNPLIPGAFYTEPYQDPAELPPLPDSSAPARVIPADLGSPASPPSGHADLTPGHIFPTRPKPAAQSSDIYQQNGGRYATSGGRMQGTSNNGGPRGNSVRSSDQLFPHGRYFSAYRFQDILPTVKVFSRYLVLVGLSIACVLLILAAWSVVFGSQSGASRVLGTAGGLILLLMSYTIYKIVQWDTFSHGEPWKTIWTSWASHYRDGTRQPLRQQPARQSTGSPPLQGPFGPPEDPAN